VVLAATSALPSEPARAQGQGSPPSREELEHLLEVRDAVIRDLLRRVEELERQQGTATTAAAPAPAAPPGPRTAARAPSVPSPRPEATAAPSRAEAAPAAPAAAEPGRVVVDEEAAQRALERTLVQTGVLLLPPGQAEITPSFAYTRAEEEAATGLLSDGTTVTTEDFRRNLWDADLGFRVGLPYDAQLELDIPYRFVGQSSVTRFGFAPTEERNESGNGWGDLTIGLAKTLAREKGWLPDLIGRVDWNTATGERFDNGVSLGGGAHEVSVQLSATKRQDPLVFAGALAYTKAFEQDRFQSGDSIGYSLTAYLAASPETSLRFGFSQSFVDEAEFEGNRIQGSDFVSATLNLGASTTLGARTLLDVGGSIGLTDESPDFMIQVSLPLRFDLPFRD